MPGFFGFVEDTLFPKRCVSCGALGNYLCPTCRKSIVPFVPQRCPMCDKPAIDGLTHPRCRTKYGMDGLVGLFRYAGPVRSAIKEIKYRFSYDIANELVSLVPEYPQMFLKKAVIVPIPLHAARLRYRGFNQAAVFGRIIAAANHRPLVEDLLVRMHPTKAQAEIRMRKERFANVRGAFGVSSHNCLGMRIVLVDDVATTGATMCAAAQTLKRAGAAEVFGLAIAR